MMSSTFTSIWVAIGWLWLLYAHVEGRLWKSENTAWRICWAFQSIQSCARLRVWDSILPTLCHQLISPIATCTTRLLNSLVFAIWHICWSLKMLFSIKAKLCSFSSHWRNWRLIFNLFFFFKSAYRLNFTDVSSKRRDTLLCKSWLGWFLQLRLFMTLYMGTFNCI